MKPIDSFEQLIQELDPVLKQLEEKRVQLKYQAIKKSIACGVILFFIATAFSFFVDYIFVFAVALIILIIYIAIVFNIPSKQLCADYKKEVISRLVNLMVENGTYEPDRGISEWVFNDSCLFMQPDRYSSEDLISGLIDKTSFEFAEIHAEERQVTSNGKTTQVRWVTIFKGFFFVADFHKDFAGRTVVARNSFLKLRRGRVKMENPEFERKFDVFSTDQVEARYLLTPSMMERILDLNNKFGNNIALSFSNSNVIIAINHSINHFEAGLWSPVNNKERLLREYNLINSMIGIVEELNLNTRIWSKS